MSDKLTKLTGEYIFHLIDDIANSKFSLNQDYGELGECHVSYLKIDLLKREDQKKLRTVLLNFSRLLRNYLAGYCSLIDQLMKARDKLGNEQLKKDYKLELEKLHMIEITRFAGDLRNYSLHKRLPLIRARLGYNLKPDGTSFPKIQGSVRSFELSLQKSELLKWDKWDPISIKFLESYSFVHRDDVMIYPPLVSVWHKSISEFCRWFTNEACKYYAKELTNYISEKNLKEGPTQDYFRKLWENSSL